MLSADMSRVATMSLTRDGRRHAVPPKITSAIRLILLDTAKHRLWKLILFEPDFGVHIPICHDSFQRNAIVYPKNLFATGQLPSTLSS